MAVDRTERLLNLVITLLSSRRPVSRDAIRRGVPGYSESASDAAFERMFERDKDELRSMGIPVQTVGPEGEIEGYVIPHGDYALSLELTPEECAVVALAAAAWDSATSVSAGWGAVRKVEGGNPSTPGPSGAVEFRPARMPSAAALPVLLDAVRQRRAVRFDYRKPEGGRAEPRRLEPWAVLSWRCAWYVIGRDVDRDERRVFRLSRIAGPVSPEGRTGAYTPPDDGTYRALVEEWASAQRTDRALVRVASGAGARLRLLAEGAASPMDEAVLSVPFGDPEAVTAEILAAGDAAEVSEPEYIRSAVIDRLQRLIELHS